MKTTTETKKVKPLTVTLAKGGTGEKTIELSKLVIPDLWHIAQSLEDERNRAMVLECWHIAHDLKRELEERAA